MAEAAEKCPPWGPEKKIKWFSEQRIHRSYHDDVLVRLEQLKKAGAIKIWKSN